MVGVRQHHLHEDVVVGGGVEAGNIKAQKRKHPPGEKERIRHAGRPGKRARAAGFPERPRLPPFPPTIAPTRLPALLGDDHLRLVPVEFQPERPVAQVDLRLARHQPRLGGGELVERGALVGMAVLLGVGVARRRVALRRGVGQEAVIGAVGDDGVVSHVAAGAGDGEGRVSGSVLAGVGEHGTGRGGSRLGLAGLREQIAICGRSIETVTKLGDPVQDGREFISLDVPWCVLGVGKIVCI